MVLAILILTVINILMVLMNILMLGAIANMFKEYIKTNTDTLEKTGEYFQNQHEAFRVLKDTIINYYTQLN